MYSLVTVPSLNTSTNLSPEQTEPGETSTVFQTPLCSTKAKLPLLLILPGSVTGSLKTGYCFPDITISDALKAYYDAHTMPAAFKDYLKSAVDGTNPFAYIKGTGTNTHVSLVDAVQHYVFGIDISMVIPDDFPTGTYVFQGMIRDLSGNENPVTLKLIITYPYRIFLPVIFR